MLYYAFKYLLPLRSPFTGSDKDLHEIRYLCFVECRKNTFALLQGLLKPSPTQLLKHADIGSLTSQYCFNLLVSFYNTLSLNTIFLRSPHLYILLWPIVAKYGRVKVCLVSKSIWNELVKKDCEDGALGQTSTTFWQRNCCMLKIAKDIFINENSCVLKIAYDLTVWTL